jgi:glycosyltransferase involved in cell wall biosynthesis
MTLATAVHEDWGLTPIEGNAYSKAAICVNSGGYKESQIEGKTGFLRNNSAEEFSRGMSKMAKDLAYTKKLGGYSRKISKKYSWKEFRYNVSKFYEHLFS